MWLYWFFDKSNSSEDREITIKNSNNNRRGESTEIQEIIGQMAQHLLWVEMVKSVINEKIITCWRTSFLKKESMYAFNGTSYFTNF